MNRKTKKALKGSIAKWEKIVSGKGVDEGWNNCLLCEMFIEDDCKKCPVDTREKGMGCSITPYITWVNHQEDEHKMDMPWKVECDECKEIAQKEVNFLKSLTLGVFQKLWRMGFSIVRGYLR